MVFALSEVTAPGVEPVSRTEAKAHLRVDHTDEDTLIDALIVAARRHCETVTRRALITQTWDVSYDRFPCGDRFRLPLPRLQSVTSLTYRDADEASATVASSTYIVDTASEPGEIVLGYGEVWPSVTLSPSKPVTVRFVAGYGDAGTDVPQEIRQAMFLLIGELYERREEATVGASVVPNLLSVDRLLQTHRVLRF